MSSKEFRNGNTEKKNGRQSILEALRSVPDLFSFISACTKLPYVVCDPETYDDEIRIFLDRDEAKEEGQRFLEEKIPVQVARVEHKHFLAFYTSLYTMGVNALLVTDKGERHRIQLEEFLKRKTPENQPEGKVWIENPALHLTTLYYMQELRRQPNAENTPKMRELQEEITAHLKKGSYILGVEKETGRVPLMKLGADAIYQPFFTDALEFQKFNKEDKLQPVVIPFEKIFEALAPEAKGMLLNPMGVNMPLALSRGNVAENAPSEAAKAEQKK